MDYKEYAMQLLTFLGGVENITSMQHISKAMTTTVVLTNEKNRHFDKCYDQVIYIHTSEPTESRVSTTSRLTMLYVVDLLYFSYLDQNLELAKGILDYNSRL